MLYHSFAPLKENYETIVISPSTMEHELVSTPEYMKQLDTKKKGSTFRTWNIVEDIVRTTVSQWKEKGYEKCKIRRNYINPDRMKFFSPSWVEDKQFKWVYDWLEQIVDLAEPYYAWEFLNLRSHNSLVEIDASWYKVLLKGECDWWIDWHAIFDCKTAKSKWNTWEKRAIWCYQARFYSRMQFLAHPEIEKVSFTYLIFIKNKKPLLQEFTTVLTREECEAFVWDRLKEYLTKVKKWEIKTSEEALDRL